MFPVLTELDLSIVAFLEPVDLFANVFLEDGGFDLCMQLECDACFYLSSLQISMYDRGILHRLPIFVHNLIFAVQPIEADHSVLRAAANISKDLCRIFNAILIPKVIL